MTVLSRAGDCLISKSKDGASNRPASGNGERTATGEPVTVLFRLSYRLSYRLPYLVPVTVLSRAGDCLISKSKGGASNRPACGNGGRTATGEPVTLFFITLKPRVE